MGIVSLLDLRVHHKEKERYDKDLPLEFLYGEVMSRMTTVALLASLFAAGYALWGQRRLQIQFNELEGIVMNLEVGGEGLMSAAPVREVIAPIAAPVEIHKGVTADKIFLEKGDFCSYVNEVNDVQKTLVRFDGEGNFKLWEVRGTLDIDLKSDPIGTGTYQISGLYIFTTIKFDSGETVNRRIDIVYYDPSGEITDMKLDSSHFSRVNCR